MGSQAAVEMCMSVAVGGSLAAEGPALLLEMGTVGEGERGGGPGAGGGEGKREQRQAGTVAWIVSL